VLQFVSCDDAPGMPASTLARRENCNDWSVGIELEGLEGEPFEPAQYRQLARLLRALARRYPLHEVVGHEHVAPGAQGRPGARLRLDVGCGGCLRTAPGRGCR
jgi:AmpD protein